MKADLHMHSTISDGSLSLKQLAKYGELINLDYMAVTDHDTTKNFNLLKEAFSLTKVTPIPALEVSAFDYKKNNKAHILAYFIKDVKSMEDYLSPLVSKREEDAKYMISKIYEAGFPITYEMVKEKAKDSTNIYKQHIMDVLMDLGFSSTLKGDLYNKLFKINKEKKEVGVAYTELKYFDAIEAVKVIRDCGGVPVLAHPAGYKNMELIPSLIKAGLMGLEANHPTHSLEDRKMVEEIAINNNLIVTGGSDFHGRFEGFVNPLGNSLTTEENLEKLLKYR